jgi:DNA polymerase-3 subunit epsilon
MHSRIRLATIQKARQIWAAQPLFLDTETTGLGNAAEIVEISILDHNGGVLLDTLVRPRRSIPADAIQVHGIRNEMVRDAPTWMHVWPQVESILAGRQVGIYNAEFDLRMMRQSHHVIGLPWRRFPGQEFCVMRLYADFYGSRRWQRLEDAGRQSGINLPNSHRARGDTLLTLEVFKFMVDSQH